MISILSRLREQATDLAALDLDEQHDDFLELEADHLEMLLGNYLLGNPRVFDRVANDLDIAEEFGDSLNVDWQEFLANVKSQLYTM